MYSRLVYSVAVRVGLGGPDAEDCAQHTWLSLFKHRRSIQTPAALPAWLIRTTHRQAIRLMERHRRASGAEEQDQLIAQAHLPDKVVEQIELEGVIQFALTQLDPRCRRLLLHLFFDQEEQSYRKLAAALGVKTNSLGPMRGRCLKKLEQILKKMGYELD